MSRIHCLHLSQPRRSSETSSSSSSSAQIAEIPLKIASASGNTPPPEDPEEPHDHDKSHNDDLPPAVPRSDPFTRPARRGRGRPRGSLTRRSLKSLRPRTVAVFKPEIPEWFLARNVTLCDDLRQVIFPSEEFVPLEDDSQSSLSNDEHISTRNTITSRIAISPFIRKELESHLSAALLVKPGGSRDANAARKAHIHLQCSKRGAIYFLDELVENVAKGLEADIVRLDSQDLDELLESMIDPTSPEMGFSHPQVFFTNIMRDKDPERKEEFTSEEENEEIEEDEDEMDETEFRIPPGEVPIRLIRLLSARSMFPAASMMSHSSSTFPSFSRNNPQKEDTETKISAYLDLLVSAPIDKRKSLTKKNIHAGDVPTMSQFSTRDARTIVYLRDFQSILETPRGQIAHQALLNVVHNRRRLGEKIVLLVSDDLPSDNVSSAPFWSQFYHDIKIPPPVTEAEKSGLQKDKAARTREINLRNIQSAIRQRSRIPSMEFECPVGVHLDALATSSIHDLGRDIWPLDLVQRVASIAIGNHGKWLVQHQPQHTVGISITDIGQAVDELSKADRERAEKKKEKKTAREITDPLEEPEPSSKLPKLAPINTKDCNKHEQKLLGGVIDPGSALLGQN